MNWRVVRRGPRDSVSPREPREPESQTGEANRNGPRLLDLPAGYGVPLLIWGVGIVAIWALGILVAYLTLPDWETRGQFGDVFGVVNSLFSGFAFAGVVVALLLQNHGLTVQNTEIAKAHEWNRRKCAHDLIVESTLGKFGDLRRKMETKIHIHDRKETFTTKRAELDDADMLRLDTILNWLETACIAMKNNVVDEDIVFDCLGKVLLAYHRWSRPYVDECRKTIGEGIWCEMAPFVTKWEPMVEELEKAIANARNSAVARGSPKL